MYISDNADLAENKLTILYLSKSMGLPLTNARFSQIVREGKFFNFFLLQHLLEDLQNGGYIHKTNARSGDATYEITEKGVETLEFLIHKLPKGIRKYIDKLASENAGDAKREREIISYIEPSEGNGFTSVLEIRDNDNLLFEIKYRTATRNDAVKIAETLKNNAERIYTDITGQLLT